MAPRNEEPWQVQHSKMQTRALHLFSESKWTDCTFHFEIGDLGEAADGSNNFVEAHKLILAMASPVFEAMFYGNIGDKNSVNISDIDRPTFLALLGYIYTDDAIIEDVEAAMSLYKAANKYIVVNLEKMCLDYLSEHLSPENVCKIYEFACFFDKNYLQKECLELITAKTQLVLKSSGFRSAELDTLKKIISMDTLDINSEMDLFNALIEYVEHNMETLKNDLNMNIPVQKDVMNQGQGDMKRSNENAEDNKDTIEKFEKPMAARSILSGVIENIRFLAMTPSDLTNITENCSLLSKDELCALFCNMFSPDSCVPMPDGFSSMREPRIRSAATFQYTVRNITNMAISQSLYSLPCYVRNLPWRILAQRSSDYLGLFLNCNAESLPDVSKDWSCTAKAELRLFKAYPLLRPRISKTSRKIYSKESSESWGDTKFIAWKELIDPKNKFIKDDSITIEVHFTTEPVQGADIKRLQTCILCNK